MLPVKNLSPVNNLENWFVYLETQVNQFHYEEVYIMEHLNKNKNVILFISIDSVGLNNYYLKGT